MKELLVFQGPCSSRSGYGDHARDLVRALISMDRFEIKIIDLRWGDCPRNALTTNDIDIINRISTGNIDRKPDVFVQLSVPNEFTPHGKFNIGNYLIYQFEEKLYKKLQSNLDQKMLDINIDLHSFYSNKEDYIDEITKQNNPNIQDGETLLKLD